MFTLLLHPPAPNPDAAAQILAQHWGGSAYDHKSRLLRGLPYLGPWQPEPATAQALAAQLRAAGLPAFAIAEELLDRTPDVERPRAACWDATHLQIGQRGPTGDVTWEPIPWSAITLALPCRADSAQETVTATTKKTTSMAAMAMGIPISSKKTTTERSMETDSRFFCVLWLAQAQRLIRIDAEGTSWSGLGPAMRPGTLANFQALMAALFSHCPTAWDPRLERAGGKISATPLPPQSSSDRPGGKVTVATRTRSWDTEGGVMQAVRLLVLVGMLGRRVG